MKSREKAEMIQSADIQPMEMKTAHLKLEIHDVWGGDGNKRFQKMKKTSLDRTKTKTRTKSTMPGYLGEQESGEVIVEEINKEINTFEEKNGVPLLYLGRKLRGTLKQIGANLARMGNPLFPSIAFCNDMMTMVSVTPDIIELAGENWRNNNDNYYLGSSGQKMATRGSFIPLYFDAFKKVNVEVDVNYPVCFDKQVRSMVNLLPSIKTLNRRMAQIKVVSCELS